MTEPLDRAVITSKGEALLADQERYEQEKGRSLTLSEGGLFFRAWLDGWERGHAAAKKAGKQ